MTEMQATELIAAVKTLTMVVALFGFAMSILLAALNVTIGRK